MTQIRSRYCLWYFLLRNRQKAVLCYGKIKEINAAGATVCKIQAMDTRQSLHVCGGFHPAIAGGNWDRCYRRACLQGCNQQFPCCVSSHMNGYPAFFPEREILKSCPSAVSHVGDKLIPVILPVCTTLGEVGVRLILFPKMGIGEWRLCASKIAGDPRFVGSRSGQGRAI